MLLPTSSKSTPLAPLKDAPRAKDRVEKARASYSFDAINFKLQYDRTCALNEVCTILSASLQPLKLVGKIFYRQPKPLSHAKTLVELWIGARKNTGISRRKGEHELLKYTMMLQNHHLLHLRRPALPCYRKHRRHSRVSRFSRHRGKR